VIASGATAGAEGVGLAEADGAADSAGAVVADGAVTLAAVALPFDLSSHAATLAPARTMQSTAEIRPDFDIVLAYYSSQHVGIRTARRADHGMTEG
jgi:hypothetical protein